jgi:Hsp70 protein
MEEKLIKIVYSEFKKVNEIELPTDDNTMERVRSTCEKVIVELRSLEKTDVNIPFILAGTNGPIHIMFSVSTDFIESYDLSNKDDFSAKKEPSSLHNPNAKSLFNAVNNENIKTDRMFNENTSNKFLDDLRQKKEDEIFEKKKNMTKRGILILVFVVSLVITLLVIATSLGILQIN